MTPSSVFVCGHGIDAHAILHKKNGRMWLGGVQILAGYEVIAHSDGDVVLHALVDAILGAIGEGDIGMHFPPTDPQWENAAARQFLAHALSLGEIHHATVINVDVTVISEVPKVSPHKSAIRAQLASLLEMPMQRINIKATTTEKLGFLGRKEGIAADVVVSMQLDACKS